MHLTEKRELETALKEKDKQRQTQENTETPATINTRYSDHLRSHHKLIKHPHKLITLKKNLIILHEQTNFTFQTHPLTQKI